MSQPLSVRDALSFAFHRRHGNASLAYVAASEKSSPVNFRMTTLGLVHAAWPNHELLTQPIFSQNMNFG
jgi:hypothetical protein